MKDTASAIRRFLSETNGQRRARVVAVATAAVRDAPNSGRLLRPLRAEGVEVRILSGHEEARLGAVAATWSLPITDALIFDLGGGSLQLTRLAGGRIEPLGSLPLGAVRTTRRFFRHDPPTAGEIRSLRRDTRALLRDLLSPAAGAKALVGLGGTVRTLARVHLAGAGIDRDSGHGRRLSRADVSAIRERLELLPSSERRLRGLKGERADIILAGAIVVEELMAAGDHPFLTVCARSVRHGVLIEETFGRDAVRPGLAPAPEEALARSGEMLA